MIGTIAAGVALYALIKGMGDSSSGGTSMETGKGLPHIQFIKMLRAALAKQGLNTTAQLVVIAQAAFESGWGTQKLMGNWNYWNLTDGQEGKPAHVWSGSIVLGPDTEPDGKGGKRPIVQRWISFSSVDEAVAFYLKFLSGNANHRYDKALDRLHADDAEGYIRALGPDQPAENGHPVGGYYTLNADAYWKGINDVMATVSRIEAQAAAAVSTT
jgi:hypothetical protein